jgi:hypothetical protein
MSNRYVVRNQSGYDKNGTYIRFGRGVWDTRKSQWANKYVFLNNSRGNSMVRNSCKIMNEEDDNA